MLQQHRSAVRGLHSATESPSACVLHRVPFNSITQSSRLHNAALDRLTSSSSSAAAAVPAVSCSRCSAIRHHARRLVSTAAAAVEASAPPPEAAYRPPEPHKLVMDVAGQQITLTAGEIGRLANGAVWAEMGETVVYATACCGSSPQGDGSFLPLSVHYQERFSAAGRTSGSFLKREGRPRDDDVLVARLVDRPIRPMFDKGWCNETQILEWVLSYDGVNQPEPLAITAAAAALLISDIPLKKAVAGVRVGYIPSLGFIVNPTASQMAASQLDLMMAGTAEAVLMIEGFCDWLSEEQMLEAVATGHAAISKMCASLTQWASEIGKQPKRPERLLPPVGLNDQFTLLADTQVEAAYREPAGKEDRIKRLSAIQHAAYDSVRAMDKYAGVDDATLNSAWKSFESSIMRRLVLRDGIRMDGRKVTDIRPIWSRAGVLPRTHGSALFTRGETQALCVATLGGESDAQRVDSIRSDVTTPDSSTDEDSSNGSSLSHERFYLQYFFPPSSVGECGRVGPAGRRELGHGELAQRALVPAVPSQAQFPYTVRVESTITESNGSSSMASVCGGCLAMLDAGVPLSAPVAGIAMGLILEPDGSYVVLSDILGAEDALGDMDFKVAGSASGISAFQMDIKVEGITLDIMKQALAQASAGRAHILTQMERCSPPPARKLSKWAPRVVQMTIPADKLGALIGPGGKTIRGITAASGVTAIETNNNGTVQIIGGNEAAIVGAQEMINLQLDQLPPGTILRERRISQVALFGVVVELMPGKTGLVHLSELGEEGQVLHEVPPQYKVDGKLDVMYLGATGDGKTRLSHRGVLMMDAGKPYNLPTVGAGSAPSSPRTPRSSEGGSSSFGRGPGGRGSRGGRGGYIEGRGGRGRGAGRSSSASSSSSSDSSSSGSAQ